MNYPKKGVYDDFCSLNQIKKRFWLNLIYKIEFYFTPCNLMASKKAWIDMSDSESDEEHHHHHHEQKHEEQPKQTPALNKIVSSPLPDKKSANQQQNLAKLENCSRDEIWLYIPLYYKDNIEDVDQMLRKTEVLKKIEKFSKGWNVLTPREHAKLFITEGKREGRFFIKFYFSNKNQQPDVNTPNRKVDSTFRNNDYSDNRKVKYVAKSPNSKADLRDMKSPEALRKVQSQQQSIPIRTPKSPTYKNQQWKKYDDRDYKSSNYKNSDNNRRVEREGDNNRRAQREDDDDSLNKDKAYRPKYVTKNSRQQQPTKPKQEYNAQSPRRKYVQKRQEQPKVDTPVSPKVEKSEKPSTNQQQKLPQQKQPKQEIEQVNEEDNEPAMNSPGEKKAKKKNKKKNQLAKDNNNPFSMLNGI